MLYTRNGSSDLNKTESMQKSKEILLVFYIINNFEWHPQLDFDTQETKWKMKKLNEML